MPDGPGSRQGSYTQETGDTVDPEPSGSSENRRVWDDIKAVLSELSHDIRTPLNTIIGFSQMMEEELLGPIGTPKYREYASIIGKSGKLILEQFNNQVTRERLANLKNTGDHEHVIELAPDMICICRDGLISKMNAAGLAMLGIWKSDAVVGRRFTDFVHEDYLPIFDDGMELIKAEGQMIPMKFIHADNWFVDVHVNALPYHDEDDHNENGEDHAGHTSVILTVRDVTHRQRAMRKIIDHAEQIRKIMATVTDGIVLLDSDGRIETINTAGERMFGYDPGELVGTGFAPMLGHSLGETIAEIVAYIHDDKDVIHTRGPVREVEGIRKDGTTFPLEISIDETSTIGRRIYIGSFRDISVRRDREQKLRLLATRDSLTGLPNRYQFEQNLQDAIKRADACGGSFGAVNINLNSFKTINDALGHSFGNKVIASVGARLQECLHDKGTLAHLGSDDFFVLIEGSPTTGLLENIAADVCKQVARPLFVDGKEMLITCTIGICQYPEHAKDREEVMQHADVAVHHAKLTNPDGFSFYTHELRAQASRDMEIERNLRRAIERDEFRLLYQPKIDLQDRQVMGCEALLRWECAELGFVPPTEFIRIAERSSLIIDIGQWVLDEACQQGKAWVDAGLPPVHIAVNVSAVQFLQGRVDQQILRAISQSGFSANHLDIELTESTFVGDIERTIKTLLNIKSQGMTVSMDDFGTGYSSLSYLARLPLDSLKVDRSFVMNLSEDEYSATLIRTIVSLARQLGLSVVAEGIETKHQEEFMTALGCEMGQGFLFGKPLPVDEFAIMLETGLDA